LSEQECWRHLKEADLGRIAIATSAGVDVLPLNFRVVDRSIYFRTRAGTELVATALANPVAIQIDAWNAFRAWSVVARGPLVVVEGHEEIALADSLNLHPWPADIALVHLRLTPTEVTGLNFTPDM
jgi:nitroimidazol reductase NimA-like FMN-containing flavoprotein (pyridoxamine 5'-phosphate oxidase superfamily)